MRPVIQGIAHEVWHTFDELKVFFIVVVGTGNAVLGIAAGAEGAPFVVVAVSVACAQPDLR